MANLMLDEYGWLEEPCLSCDKCYVDNLFYEWTCDEKVCLHKAEIGKSESEGPNDEREHKEDADKNRHDIEQVIYINGEKYVTKNPVIKTEHKDEEISIAGFYRKK